MVDVNLQVWGDDWAEPLDHLTATMSLPGLAAPGEVFVWGHPATVAGTTNLGTDRVQPSLEASNIPPGQFVEMRVMFPRRLLTSTAGATVIDGQPRSGHHRRGGTGGGCRPPPGRPDRALVIGLGAVDLRPRRDRVAYIYFRYGREPRVDYDREYEQEPPTDLPPAEVGAAPHPGPDR